MSRIRRSTLVLGALCALACGSTESSGLTRPGGSGAGGSLGSGGGGGASGAGSGGLSDAAGGAPSGGAGTGAGGQGASLGNGGSAGGSATDGGPRVPVEGGAGAGGATVMFPSGGVISAQCADCATQHCQKEAAVCQADQKCWDIGLCVTKTFFPPQIAACLLASQPASTEFNTLQCCTSRACAGTCPSLNAGVIGCP